MKKLLITLIAAIFTLGGISQAGNYTLEQQDAYYYAYSQKITTISSIEKANMNGQLTRIAMAKMLSNFAINVLGLQPDTSKDCSFSDVPSSLDSDYNYGATQACQLGLMGIGNDGKKSDKFNPYTTVTRAQFATAFSRALSKANGKVIENGNPYYSTHLAYLQSEGIIKNTSASNIERRGNVMIMMQRASNEDKKIEENNEIKGNTEYYNEDLDSNSSETTNSDKGSEINSNEGNETTSYKNYIKLEKGKSSKESDLTISINNKSKGKMRIVGIKLGNYKSNESANVYFGDNTMDSITKNGDNTATVKFPYPIDINGNSSDTLTVRANTIGTKVTIDSIIFEVEEDNYGKDYSVTKNDTTVANWEDLYAEKSVASYIKLEKGKTSKESDLTISINNKSKGKMRIVGVKLGNYKSNESANVYFGDNTMDSITKNGDNTATVKFPYPIDINGNSSDTLTVRANTIGSKVTIDSIIFEVEEDNYGKDYSVTKNDTTVANWEDLYAEK